MTASAAARQRLCRARKRDGRIAVTMEVDRAIIDALIDKNRLGAWDEDNRKAIAAALAILNVDWAGCVTRDGVDPVRRATKRFEDRKSYEALMREALKKFSGPDATRQLAAAFAAYERGPWSIEQDSPEVPVRKRGTIDELFWRMLKINPLLPNAARIADVLSVT